MSFVLISCNKNLTEEEKDALWENAQTQGEIIRRSGTPFNLATDPDLALSDAENRLRTGGGLFGKKASLDFFGNKQTENDQTTASVGMPINPYLWKASLETVNFMPLSSTDPFAGTIITDWYTAESKMGERCKLNIFISGLQLKTSNLKVSSFCQVLIDNQWVNQKTNMSDNIKLENSILNKAKKLKLSSS
tara:strand:+ start:6550 stop:7122 length:573 start_codon:yes stop_codon:yes gene_type:complete